MNLLNIIFSGIMTALIFAMIGVAVSYIADREERKLVIVITGAILGFIIGASQEAILQQKRLRDRNDLKGEDNEISSH